MPLLCDYRITLEVMKCSPQAETVGCLVELEQDIAQVLPYLNAVLPRCRYNPNAPALEIGYGGRGITLWARRVVFGGVTGSGEAEEVMESVRELVNDTWERRDRITPSDRQGPVLSPLEVFQLLPGVNCGACGEPTCLAFAAKVARETAGIGQCPSLARPGNVARRKRLAALLGQAGYEVPQSWGSEQEVA